MDKMKNKSGQSLIEYALILAVVSIVALAIFGVRDSSPKPQAVNVTSNSEYQVAFLFENNGVKVYRFSDSGREHYYIDARGSTSTQIPSGKTSYLEENRTIK